MENRTANINNMVYESLLDNKIEAVKNQGAQLDQLMSTHNNNVDRLLQMRHQQLQNQAEQVDKMHQNQQDNASKLELKQITGKQAIPQTQQQLDQLQTQLQQQQQPNSMIPTGYISMPYKLSPKMKKTVNKLDSVRDALLNLDQGLV